MNALHDTLSYLRKRYYHVDGLLVLGAFIATAYAGAIAFVGAHLAGILSALGYTVSDLARHVLFVAGLMVAEGVAVFSWCRCRALPHFKKDELGIICAPNFPEDLEAEALRLYEHLVHELKSREFGNRFSVKRLPPNHTISSADEATSTVKRCHGAAAVWGLLDTQTAPDGSRTGFSRISITVNHSPARLGPGFQRRVAESMMGRRWHFDERNQIVDRLLLARNIGEVVRYLLGLALLVSHRFDDAIKIFLPLCAQLQPLAGPDAPLHVRQFHSNVRRDAAFSLRANVETGYSEYLRTNRLFAIPNEALHVWYSNIEEAIKLDRQDSGHFLIKAILLFLNQRVRESIEAARHSLALAPKADSAPNLSLGFLFMFMGNLKEARKQYKLAFAKKTSYRTEMIQDIASFIRQSIDHFPDKPQLRLALGMIELFRGDPKRGREEITSFVRTAESMHAPRDFVEEGRKLLRDRR